MDRRSAIKFFIKSAGLSVSVPAVFSCLSACQKNSEQANNSKSIAKFNFLSKHQAYYVSQLVDVILPTTSTVGGGELSLTYFIDEMMSLAIEPKNQSQWLIGFEQFSTQLEQRSTTKQPSKIDFQNALNQYLAISPQQQEQIYDQQKLAVSNILEEDLSQYYLYKFLLMTRDLALLGFYTSQTIGEDVLNYDPIPGEYNACILAEDVGNSWSL